MSITRLAAVLLVALAAMAQAPLPGLRTEPVGGGSIFTVRNGSSQPLTAYLIELVNYPGSSYSLWQDDLLEPIAAGGEKRIQVANMTVGAVPDYCKLQAAIYADGSTSGIPEKVAQLVGRRRAALATTRELIARLEKARVPATAKPALIADLRNWAGSMQPPTRANRNSQAAIDQAASLSLIHTTVTRLEAGSVDETLAGLRVSEHALAASKPAL